MTVQPKQGTPIPVYLFRFLAGHPMDGVRRTNYTFLRRANRDLTMHGRSHTWHHLPGYHRSLYRLGFTVALIAVLYGYSQSPATTDNALIAFGSLFMILGILISYRSIRDSRHHNRTVKPLYQMSTMITDASSVFGHSHSDNHKKYITVPRNYKTNKKTRIKLVVPHTWEATKGSQQRMLSIVTQKLGGEWDVTPHLSVFPPYLEFYPSPAPPDKLLFNDIKAALDAGSPNKIIMGMGTHEKIVSIDLDSESPHVAISMGTGGGKSSFIRLVVAYLIHHGVERIDIIDPKRISHNWAKDIPGVFIHRTMAQQMDAIHNFRMRMESRYDALDTDEEMKFSRHVLILEEQNSWMNYAQEYWKDYRNELDPKEKSKVSNRNPAIGDLSFILFQGRQACMNVFSIFQRMSASAAGGGDMRENYGAKILARFSAQTWKILVGTTPIPRSSRINGRGHYVLGEEDHLIQMAFITEQEARDYAISGKPVIEKISISDDPDPDSPISLREAVDAKIIPMRLPAVKRARTRAGREFAPSIPTPIGNLYKPSDLRAWYESRNSKSDAA